MPRPTQKPSIIINFQQPNFTPFIFKVLLLTVKEVLWRHLPFWCCEVLKHWVISSWMNPNRAHSKFQTFIYAEKMKKDGWSFVKCLYFEVCTDHKPWLHFSSPAFLWGGKRISRSVVITYYKLPGSQNRIPRPNNI